MPYMIVKDKDSWCVHHQNRDKSPGDKMKCYPSEEEANKYLAALYSNVPDAKKKDIGESIDEHLNNIRKNFDAQFNSSLPMNESRPSNNWVIDTYENFVIVSSVDQYFQVKYSEDEQGQITFDPVNKWKKVEKKWVLSKAWLNPDEELVYFGDEVKALENGKVGGYLIRYSTSKDPDLTADYFTKDTNIEIPKIDLPIFYAHGTDSKLKKRIIGRGNVKSDDVGVWLEAQITQRDEYEKAVLAMCKAGKLGYSSGALSHLVEREDTGNGRHMIKTWVVGGSEPDTQTS